MRKSFLTISLCLLAGSSFAQQSIAVDNSQLTTGPLVKIFGTNLPSTIDESTFKANADKIKDLGIHYIRIAADFPAYDDAIGRLKGWNVSPDIVLVGTLDKDAIAAEITNIAGQLIDNDAIAPAYEVLSNIGQYAGQGEAYREVVVAAKDALEKVNKEKYGTTQIRQHLYLGGQDGDFNADLNGLFQNDEYRSTVWANPFNTVGIADLAKKINELGQPVETGHGAWEWEVVVTNLQPAADEDPVINFLGSVNEALTASGFTRVFVGQAIDGTDGSKGLIAADGSTTSLYQALRLYNQLPVESKAITTNGSLKALASSNANHAGIVVWNPTAAAQDAAIALNSLPFAAGEAKITTIGGATTTEAVAGSAFSKTISVPANGAVFVLIDNATPVTEYEPIKGAVATHHQWWFKFSEGWGNNYLDPTTATVILEDRNAVAHGWALGWDPQPGDVGDWGMTNNCMDFRYASKEDAPKKIHVDAQRFGENHAMDPNSTIWLAIQFESEYSEDDYSEIFYSDFVEYQDPENVFENTSHEGAGHWPGGEGINGAVYTAVDFSKGWDIDLAAEAPEDWNGNFRVIGKLQNPGAHETATLVKFQLLDPTKPIDTAISAVKQMSAASNGATYNLNGQRVSNSYKGLVITNGQKYLKK